MYFSGYVKAIHDDDPSIKNGVAGKNFGPIAEWWITGFDVGESPTVGISTENGDYILMQPSDHYRPFYSSLMTKVLISKVVIEFINYEPNATYEDLISHVQVNIFNYIKLLKNLLSF